MYIRVTTSPNGKCQKVYLVEAYRNHDGKQRQRILKKYGNLSDILAKDPNGLEKLKAKYKLKPKIARSKIIIDRDVLANEAKDNLNYGYFYIERVYNQLGISASLNQAQKRFKFKYDINQIMRLLVYSRILNPASKLQSHGNQHRFFEPFHLNLTNIYRSLSVMSKVKDDIQSNMHKRMQENYDRKLDLVLYDITNYYFATERENELRKVGVSKERKTTPIVQMGLLIDQNKIPIGYELFPGNTHDAATATSIIKKLKVKFGFKRTILVADKGVNSLTNLSAVVKNGDGYIMSQKIRGTNKNFIDTVLSKTGYEYEGNTFKWKTITRTRSVRDRNNKMVSLQEKVVIYWSQKFDQREKRKRHKLNQRIDQFLQKPGTLNASNSYGLKRYIKTRNLNKATGEISKVNSYNFLDQDKYNRDVALDGYYAIVTSEIDMPAREVIARYHELWKIEESFKVIKSDLVARPVFVRREDHIEGHFLTCFIALTILRVLERQLHYNFSCAKIKADLQSAQLSVLHKDDYLLHRKTGVIKQLENVYNATVRFKYPTLEEMRKFKKQIVHYKK